MNNKYQRYVILLIFKQVKNNNKKEVKKWAKVLATTVVRREFFQNVCAVLITVTLLESPAIHSRQSDWTAVSFLVDTQRGL